MILDKNCHCPWESRQQTRNPKELWPLCKQATLHPRPSWLFNGKRESVSSYSAAHQSPESTRLGMGDCICLLHTGGGRRNSGGTGWSCAWSKGIYCRRKAAGYAELWASRIVFLIFIFFFFAINCEQINVLAMLKWYQITGALKCKLPWVGYFSVIAI